MSLLTRLHCALWGHDDMRAWEPGRVFCQCQVCGRRSVGLRGPVSPALAPVVKVRKLRTPKAAPLLRVVKTRRSA
jgi:hypothetical protein